VERKCLTLWAQSAHESSLLRYETSLWASHCLFRVVFFMTDALVASSGRPFCCISTLVFLHFFFFLFPWVQIGFHHGVHRMC
jgi:hypothetical protein